MTNDAFIRIPDTGYDVPVKFEMADPSDLVHGYRYTIRITENKAPIEGVIGTGEYAVMFEGHDENKIPHFEMMYGFTGYVRWHTTEGKVEAQVRFVTRNMLPLENGGPQTIRVVRVEVDASGTLQPGYYNIIMQGYTLMQLPVMDIVVD